MPIREMLIAFFVMLAVGAVMNDWPKDEDPLRNAMSAFQPDDSAGQNATERTGQNGASKPLFDNPLIATGTESNFQEEVLGSKIPVLVEFYMEDDAECKSMVRPISEIATQYQGTIKVVRVDVMSNPTLMQQYQIGTLPGLILFQDGKKVQALAGEMPKGQLVAYINKLVGTPGNKAGRG